MAELGAEELDAINNISPTDAHILSALAEGRNVPVNIADEIERNPSHVSDRLAYLREMGLVEIVGSKSVSLHEITERGIEVHEAHEQFQMALRA